MPIYEYLCQACGHELEAIQKISDPVLSLCPSCGKAELKKCLSAPGFQLKGTGWYATDFKNGGKKKDNKESPSKEGASSDSASTDSAPAKTHSCGDGCAH